MKKSLLTLMLAAAASVAVNAQEAQNLQLHREHRAVWTTPYLSSNWPSSPITASNAQSVKNIMTKRLAIMKEQGINIMYYHVRSNCDATYQSSYEPWSAQIVGTRGGEAPAFDPFGFLVEEAHKYGIEVYAWLNPYRYKTSSTGYGAGELNYENSHPDWLLTSSSEIILNPGLPEVRQRIVDVISEIVTNYDVDGVVFDDYFYTNGSSLTLDADLYKKYTDGGGKLTQKAWRRENVNQMVRDVHKAIKDIKPWCPFGISPAGTISPADIADYGLPAGPYGDWQYDGIASDPMKWLKEGVIDFLSPQVYWSEKFNALTDWYMNAVPRFNRHLYTAITLQNLTTEKIQSSIKQVNYLRDSNYANAGGVSIFQYGDFVNYREKYNGTSTSYGDIMKQETFQTKVLVPLRPWNNVRDPKYITGLKAEGNTLTWTAPAQGLRYTVYAYTPGEFNCSKDDMIAVAYTNSCDITDHAGKQFAVCVYDRYGNEYAPVTTESAKGNTSTTLAAPADGAEVSDIFRFGWENESNAKYLLEIAADADFKNLIAQTETSAKSISAKAVARLEGGKTYWWRVTTMAANTPEATTAARTFTVGGFGITSIDHNASTPTLNWSSAADGAEYLLEISRNSNMSNVLYTHTTASVSHAIPEKVLSTGRTYYARLTASADGASSMSEIHKFNTPDVADYTAPVLTNPAADGQTLHANETITVAPWKGLIGVQVNIATTDAFPARSSYTGTLSDFETATNTLDKISVGGKKLVDGDTYYLRVRGSYALSTSSATQYTDYSPVVTFVYSSAAGATLESSDNALHITDGILHSAPGTVTATNAAGVTVIRAYTPGTLSLATLAPGMYIITVNGQTIKYVR